MHNHLKYVRRPFRCPSCVVRVKPNDLQIVIVELISNEHYKNWRIMCHWCGAVNVVVHDRQTGRKANWLQEWTVPIQQTFPF